MDRVDRVADVHGGIVPGHDGSVCVASARRWAVVLAARAGWELHVLRACSRPTAPRPSTWSFGHEPPLREQLAAHAPGPGADVGLQVDLRRARCADTQAAGAAHTSPGQRGAVPA